MEHTVTKPEYETKYNEDLLELLKDIDSRSFELRTNHNTAYFTFIWFLITIIAGFLGFKDDLGYTKYIFLWSIISLVVWFYLYFEESAIWIKKMENIYKIAAKAIDEQTNPSDSLNKNLEKTCREKFVWKTYVYLQNIWLLLFIVGIIIFIVSWK